MARDSSSTGSAVRPEELLAHAAWLRRLAVSLVRGAGDPDDLVQDTWLAALRRPPEDRDAPIGPWLAEVLRNLLRMRIRSEGRRARREAQTEAAEGTAAAPSPETLLERLETQRRLASLVVELPEPYRSTVLLRYYEGLSSAEIARIQGVPAGTVRFRLKTGLDKLRGALDRASSGDRRRWCLALLPLAEARRLPWSSAPTLTPTLTQTLTLTLKGVLLMNRLQKTVAIVALLLTLAAATALILRRRDPGPVTTAPGAPTTAASIGGPPAMAPAPPASADPRAAAKAPETAPLRLIAATVTRDEAAANGAFDGRVVNVSTGLGIAAAQVTFSLAGTTSTVSTGADGQFAFEPSKQGRYTLAVVTAADHLPFAPEWGHSPIELFARPGLRIQGITIFLTPAVDYTGVVLSPDDKPVVGATVTLLGASAGEQSLLPIADRFVSGERGEFVFHAPDDALLEARHGDYDPGRARLDGPATITHKLTIRLRPKGADGKPPDGEKIAGRVVDEAGLPIAGALVRAEPQSDGFPAAPARGEGLSATSQATSDDEGRFTLEGLDPAAYAVSATHADHAPAGASGVRAGTADLRLVLREGGRLSGRVTAEETGEPVPAFTVVVMKHTGPLTTSVVTTRSVIDAEGRFEIDAIEPGAYGVLATAHGFAPSPEVAAVVAASGDAARGEPVRLVLPRGGTLTGKVISAADDKPIEHARVSVEGTVGAGSSAVPVSVSAVTDARGEFELTGLEPGTRSISVGAHRHHIRILSGLRIVSGAALGPLTIDLTPTKEGEEPRVELAGIGAVLKAKDDALVIEGVIAGGGAEEAGLVKGDAILAIDGASVVAIGFNESIQRIRGPEGTMVRLAVRRAGDGGDGVVVEVLAPRRRIRT